MKTMIMKVLAVLISADFLIGSVSLLAWKRDLLSVLIVAVFGSFLIWQAFRKRGTAVEKTEK